MPGWHRVAGTAGHGRGTSVAEARDRLVIGSGLPDHYDLVVMFVTLTVVAAVSQSEMR